MFRLKLQDGYTYIYVYRQRQRERERDKIITKLYRIKKTFWRSHIPLHYSCSYIEWNTSQLICFNIIIIQNTFQEFNILADM
jgi:hypothetical protein